jgi:hypothetical protein
MEQSPRNRANSTGIQEVVTGIQDTLEILQDYEIRGS